MCGNNFTFTAGEQQFYASNGMTGEPKRCHVCRKIKKQSRDGSYGSADRYSGFGAGMGH